MSRLALAAWMCTVGLGCAGGSRAIEGVGPDDSAQPDGATADSIAMDLNPDGGPLARDSGSSDAGTEPYLEAEGGTANDASISVDSGNGTERDGGSHSPMGADSGTDVDSGVDSDSGTAPEDSGAGLAHCISGAPGAYAARFRWAGSGPGSRAYVVYEGNNLPDRTRWRASAASTSFSYSPVFTDTFLGEGGMELGGTAFIDVELSTSSLSTLNRVTIAIYGRSFHTTASGSFEWQTFDGSAATASGSVSNVAPYRWYAADATPEFRAGDGGILLRLRAGPPSGTLVVNRVEICFDAS